MANQSSVPTRHETPDVAELRRRLDALPGFTLKRLHGGPGGESWIGLDDEGGMPLSDSGFDAVLFFAEIAALEVPRLLDRLAHMTEARDNARAEVERLTARAERVRALHYAADNDVTRTPACETCHGKAGVHECGCWASEDRQPVCGHCNEGDKGISCPSAPPTTTEETTHE